MRRFFTMSALALTMMCGFAPVSTFEMVQADAATIVPPTFPPWHPGFPFGGTAAGAGALTAGFVTLGVGIAAVAIFGATHPHGMPLNVSNPHPNPYLPSLTCNISMSHRKCSGNPPR